MSTEPRRGVDLGGLRVVCLIASIVLMLLSIFLHRAELGDWGLVAFVASFLF